MVHVEFAAELVNIELVELVGMGAGRTCAEELSQNLCALLRAYCSCSVHAPCALLMLLMLPMLSLPN